MNSKSNKIIESKSDYEIFMNAKEEPTVMIIEASWSGNCQIMAPIIEKFVEQYKDDINFIGVQCDASRAFKTIYNSDVLPKLLFFNKGKLVDQVFGTTSYIILEEKIKALLEVSSNNKMFNIT